MPTPFPDARPGAPARGTIVEEDHQELIGYIAELTGELALMSRGARLDVLAYFLEMARIEALGLMSRMEAVD